MKVAPVYQECAKRDISQLLIHTGQHYDKNMSDVFFKELDIPLPDVNLEVGSGSHVRQISEIMVRVEKVLEKCRPDWVCVYGDVNSTVASALVCSRLGIAFAHVEAGLRSFDRTMPEEINRLLTDQLADLLFTPSKDADENLLREGISTSKIKCVGNIMIDTLVRLLPLALQRDRQSLTGGSNQYILVTLHRPSNVDNAEVLLGIINKFSEISKDIPVIFPLHPRTRARLSSLKINYDLDGIHLIDPIGYLDFLNLEKNAVAVITDSGGVQEETTYLGIPCLTSRDNTERPVTVRLGTNKLINWNNGHMLEQEVTDILAGNSKKGTIPPLWDGQTAKRIVHILEKEPKVNQNEYRTNPV